MNPKKFKLNKENLDLVNMIQHIVFINIKNYQNMKQLNFNNHLIRNEFELSCDNYLQLHESFSMRDWRCYYDETQDPMIKKYIIYPNKELAYHLIIEINKSYHDCSKLGIQFSDRIIQPVPIDVFNIQFEGS